MIIEIGIGVGALVTIGFILYVFLKNKGNPQATADALIADAKVIVERIEAFAVSEGKKVEDYLSQKSNIEATIAAIQADIQKAKDFADKVKSIV